VSFAWELPSPEREHAAKGYVWESKPADLAGYEQSVASLYKDGYHVDTGVPLEEGFIFPFDERVVLVGSEYAKARPR
jgi:hypothetical protein